MSLSELIRMFAITSNESIEKPEMISEIKEYLHVKRKIENDIINQLKNDADKKLILLLGNVGDGKSHLIGIIKKEKNLFCEYEYINDATESIAPDKTVNETLQERLLKYNDENLKIGKGKLILAINTGVLHSFFLSEEAQNFRELKKYVEETEVLKSFKSKSVENKIFSHISFDDYPLIEVKNGRLKSDFVSEFLKKITINTEENPFYRAYLTSKESEKNCKILIENFEFLSSKIVQDNIVDLLVKLSIEKKITLTVRNIYDFIYEIINTSSEEYQELPNLLYNKTKANKYIKELIDYDPCSLSNLKIEEMISHKKKDKKNNQYKIRKYYLQEKDCFLEGIYKDFLEIIIEIEEDKTEKIDKFIKKDFYTSFINWYGYSNKQDKLVIDKNKSYQILYKLEDLYFKSKKGKNNTVEIYFEDNEKIFIELDFLLYSIIKKHSSGYILKKIDRKNSLDFERFIQKIIENNRKNERNYQYVYQNGTNNINFQKRRDQIKIFDLRGE